MLSNIHGGEPSRKNISSESLPSVGSKEAFFFLRLKFHTSQTCCVRRAKIPPLTRDAEEISVIIICVTSATREAVHSMELTRHDGLWEEVQDCISSGNL